VALRSRLKEYYTASGLEDAVIIEYRKGSYAPVLLTQHPKTRQIES
jgi:hypothetical protein